MSAANQPQNDAYAPNRPSQTFDMPKPAIKPCLPSGKHKSDRPEYAYLQPFLKWAGGKRQLIPFIKPYVPPSYNHYYEPFVGAGAMLFALQPPSSFINDLNPELINCYQVIRDQPEELIALCQHHEQHNTKDYYYQLRQQDRDPQFPNRSPLERAARILYLNKTCFNGLFRVNSQGYFNVPYGSYTNPTIADPQIIKAVSHFLQTESVTISLGDFEAAVATATSEDFIYFDPPYQPISQTSAFTAYSRQGFGETEQIRLKQLCDRLSDRGCQVLVSNSDAPLIRDLYTDRRYQIKTVGASRAINAIGSKRGKVQELLIYNRYQTRKVMG